MPVTAPLLPTTLVNVRPVNVRHTWWRHWYDTSSLSLLRIEELQREDLREFQRWQQRTLAAIRIQRYYLAAVDAPWQFEFPLRPPRVPFPPLNPYIATAVYTQVARELYDDSVPWQNYLPPWRSSRCRNSARHRARYLEVVAQFRQRALAAQCIQRWWRALHG